MAARLDEVIRQVELTQIRSTSVRVKDGDELEIGHVDGPFTTAAAAAPGRRKRIARALGWRLSDTYRLWRVAHAPGSREDGTLFGVVVAHIAAQVLLLSLPVYAGKLVSDLTGGETHGGEVDGGRIRQNLIEAIGVIALYILLSCSASLVLMLLGIRWRAALTRELHRAYLLGGRSLAFYKVQLFACDNPDQRIASDSATFTRICCGGVTPPYPSLITDVVQALSLAVAATVVSVSRAGWRITLISYAYNVLTIGVNVLISLPIASSTVAQEAREADLRHAHVRLQMCAESVAFHAAQSAEHALLEERLGTTLVNQRKLTLEYFRLRLSLEVTGVGGSLVGLFFAAISIWSGERKVFAVAELSQILGTLDMLTSALQALPGVLPRVTTVGGLSKRLTELHALLADINDAPPPPVRPTHSADSLGCAGLAFSTPDGQRALARSLTLTVQTGGSVLVVGESGVGKSSLLRCLAGLWDADEGEIFTPAGLVFLPQKPFMCVGSLRAQVCYPRLGEPRDEASTQARDARVRDILERVHLGQPLCQFGLDGVEAWEDVLSLGEQQRVCFARLLFHRPRFAIMDESTSALDLDLEESCMRLVVEARITMLAVAHRPSVRKHFQHVLRMRRDGQHELVPVEQRESDVQVERFT